MEQSANSKSRDTIPLPEWIVAGIGLAIVCLTIGSLLYKALYLSGGAPTIGFRIESTIPQDGGTLVLATVSNAGGETVTDLTVSGAAGNEIREVVIDFIPAHSSRKIGLFFTSKRSADEVTIAASGYQAP